MERTCQKSTALSKANDLQSVTGDSIFNLKTGRLLVDLKIVHHIEQLCTIY
jgi:hypothetical protein